MPSTASTPLLSLGVDHKSPQPPAASAQPPAKRNYNLDEISQAVSASDTDSFTRSSFALKRTRSMGLLDNFIVKPSTSLTGSMADYPHLALSDGSAAPSPQPAPLPPPLAEDGSANVPSALINAPPQPASPVPPASASSQPPSEPSPAVSSPASAPSVAGSAANPSNIATLPPSHVNNKTLHDTTASSPPASSTASTSPSPQSPTPEPPTSPPSTMTPSSHTNPPAMSTTSPTTGRSRTSPPAGATSRDVANSARLENASWRTWTKAKYNLRTVAPESVNWLKDYDVTWLYGPLFNQPMNIHYTDPQADAAPPPSELTKVSSSTSISSQTNSSKTCLMQLPQRTARQPSNSSSPPYNLKPKPPSQPPQPSASSQQKPLHKPILKKRTVSDKLYARQNSGHHTPTLSSFHHQQPNPPSNPPNDSASSTPQDENDDEPIKDGGVNSFMRHHNYRHRPHIGHSDERISRQINLQYRHMPGHLVNRVSSPTASSATPQYTNNNPAYYPTTNTPTTLNTTPTTQQQQTLLSNNNLSHLTHPDPFQTPGSAPPSVFQGPSSAPSNTVVSPASLLSNSQSSSVASFRPLERHIHFNDRVEQCIAIDTYDSSSEDDNDQAEDANKTHSLANNSSSDLYGSGRGRHGHRFSRDWRSRGHDSEDSDDNSDSNDYHGTLNSRRPYGNTSAALDDDSSSSSSDSEDEDEPGLFLSLRSSSTTSLHRLDRLSALSSSSTATSPKNYHAIIAPLPATTLRAAYDAGEEEELRRAEAANSVAYAMSHNTQPRTHIYTVYDYNSVYKSPSQSPQTVQSPAQSPHASTKAIDPAQIVGPSNLLNTPPGGSDPSATQVVATEDDDDDRVMTLPSHLSAQLPLASASKFDFGSDSNSDSEAEEVIIGVKPALQGASLSATNVAGGFLGSAQQQQPGQGSGGLVRTSSSLFRSSSRTSSSANLANMNR